MRTYNDLIELVRQWSNRDEEVVGNSIIGDCLAYAADKAYRHLRIPPLEKIITYSSSELAASTSASANGRTVTEITIPEDLIEFIQIRTIDANGATVRVFNEKADVRTFYDQYAEKYSGLAYWTRKGNKIVIAPGFDASTEEAIELYYYHRLLALDTRVEVTPENANLSDTYIQEVTANNPAPVNPRTGVVAETVNLKEATYTITNTNTIVNKVYYPENYSDSLIPSAPLGQSLDIAIESYYGSEVYNWLRDENERILLTGALSELFLYLKEPETAGMYLDIFMREIQELNQEEKQRKASGGNIQINFNSNGLI